MTEPAPDALHVRLKAWGQSEIKQSAVRWTPEFIRLRASLALQERRQNRAATIERVGWTLAVTASLLGLILVRSTHGWSLILESPTVFLPAVFTLGLLGRTLWGSLEA